VPPSAASALFALVKAFLNRVERWRQVSTSVRSTPTCSPSSIECEPAMSKRNAMLGTGCAGASGGGQTQATVEEPDQRRFAGALRAKHTVPPDLSTTLLAHGLPLGAWNAVS
jgi:hypothetical protein